MKVPKVSTTDATIAGLPPAAGTARVGTDDVKQMLSKLTNGGSSLSEEVCVPLPVMHIAYCTGAA